MIREKVLDRLARQTNIINIKSQRCLRSRFNECNCTRCVDVCRKGAITLNGGLRIDEELCTECMMCVAQCPSEGISITNYNPFTLISGLRKVRHPVLGCHVKSESLSHVRTYCLGLLSEEDIIAMLYLMDEPLQLNLTDCEGCKNAFIIPALEDRLKAVGDRLSPQVFGRIIMVRDRGALRYEEPGVDRRGFFKAMKKGALTGMANILVDKGKEGPVYASQKAITSKRQTLNRVHEVVSDGIRRRLCENYYFDLSVKDDCDLCGACAAVCPTGALKVEWADSSTDLLFNSSLCIGCSLCVGFCENSHINLAPASSEDNLFEFTIKRQSMREDY